MKFEKMSPEEFNNKKPGRFNKLYKKVDAMKIGTCIKVTLDNYDDCLSGKIHNYLGRAPKNYKISTRKLTKDGLVHAIYKIAQ